MPPTESIDLGTPKRQRSKKYRSIDLNLDPSPLTRSELSKHRLEEEQARNSLYVKIVTQTQWMLATVLIVASLGFILAKFFLK